MTNTKLQQFNFKMKESTLAGLREAGVAKTRKTGKLYSIAQLIRDAIKKVYNC